MFAQEDFAAAEVWRVDSSFIKRELAMSQLKRFSTVLLMLSLAFFLGCAFDGRAGGHRGVCR